MRTLAKVFTAIVDVFRGKTVSRDALTAHKADAIVHITDAERTAWNGKATMESVNTAIESAIGGAIKGGY